MDALIYDDDTITYNNDTPDDIMGVVKNMTTIITSPHYISLGSDPFDNIVEICISTCGKHPTLGLHLSRIPDLGDKLQLLGIEKSTPDARIPQWRSILRSSFPLSIGDTLIVTRQDLEIAVHTARQDKLPSIQIKLRVMQKTDIHPQNGVQLVNI